MYLTTKNEKYNFGRSLTKILRHGAVKRGLHIRPDGFVKVNQILNLPENQKFTVRDLLEVVEDDNKQRFSLLLDEQSISSQQVKEVLQASRIQDLSNLYIRANQGHSIESVESEELLTPITSLEQLNDYCNKDKISGKYIIVHGTYKGSWKSIKEQGLSRMSRKHVHLACGLPKEKQVISGMRSSVDLYIYIDIKKAMDEGLKFFLSDNKVILTEGNEKGILETKYFWKVVDRQTTSYK